MRKVFFPLLHAVATLNLPKSPAASRVQQGTVFWGYGADPYTKMGQDSPPGHISSPRWDSSPLKKSPCPVTLPCNSTFTPSFRSFPTRAQHCPCPVGLKGNRDFSRLGGGHSPDAPKIGMGQEFGYKTSHFWLMG